MSSRQIVDMGSTIKKIVPHFDCCKVFPKIEDIDEDSIYERIDGSPQLFQSAVVQQYNELKIYSERANTNVLAPILFWEYDDKNLPILYFPKFEPLFNDENFYSLTDEENYIKLGMACAHFGYDFSKIRLFIREVKEVCEWFGLREDDIFYNLSNIGFNSEYGLRVIDYGLIESSNDRTFELLN